MEINLNILLEVSPELEELVERLIEAVEAKKGEDSESNNEGHD